MPCRTRRETAEYITQIIGLVRRLERMTGIEPALSAWEAEVLPLNYIRVAPERPESSYMNRRGSVQPRLASLSLPPSGP
jgi:hypothetical protein